MARNWPDRCRLTVMAINKYEAGRRDGRYINRELLDAGKLIFLIRVTDGKLFFVVGKYGIKLGDALRSDMGF